MLVLGAQNDYFHIENIEDYPNNKVTIFNRWGNKVFEMTGYNNSDRVWRSEAEFGVIPGANRVPSGTYFFLIELGNGTKPISGFVVVVK